VLGFDDQVAEGNLLAIARPREMKEAQNRNQDRLDLENLPTVESVVLLTVFPLSWCLSLIAYCLQPHVLLTVAPNRRPALEEEFGIRQPTQGSVEARHQGATFAAKVAPWRA
jgi:hypothetical protein